MSVNFSSYRGLIAAYILPTSQISISLWFKITSWAASNQVFFGANGGAFEINIDLATKKIRNWLYLGRDFPTTVLNLNQLYHYVATADSTTGNSFEYLDNVSEGSDTGHTTIPATPQQVYVGGRTGDVFSKTAYATFHDFRVYSRILNTKEINNIYHGRGKDTIYDYKNRWKLFTLGNGTAPAGINFYDDIGKETMSSGGTGGTYQGGVLNLRRHNQ